MPNPPLRIGIVGASVNRGWGWRSHIPAILGLPDCELAAICTAHQETADEAAKATGAKHAFADYRQLVEHPDVEAVTIAVRVPWHREIALAAIAAGKHVYCEWPLGVNPGEVAEMTAAAKAAGVCAMPGMQGRVAPWVLYFRHLIEQGYVGRLLTVNARLTMAHPYQRAGIAWAAKRAGGNHILTIQTAHMLDIVSFACGGLRTVSSVDSTMVPQWTLPSGETIEVDAPDQASIRGTLGNGASVSAHFAYVPHHGAGWRLEAYGDQGTLVATSPGPAMVMPNRIQGGAAGDKALQDLPVPEAFSTVPAAVPNDSSAYHVAHMYQRLAAAVRDGVPLEPSFASAMQLYDLVDTLERSSQQGGALQTIGS